VISILEIFSARPHAGVDVADGDVLPIADVSDTDANKTKGISIVQLLVAIKARLGTAAGLDVGTGVGTVPWADDLRFSDERTPVPHGNSHKNAGLDQIRVDEFAAPTDNTNGNVSTTTHGFVPKAPSDTQKFLRGDGTWAVPTVAEPFKVGGIYMNVTGVNPTTELGYGTWVAFGEGRFIAGYKSADADFGTVEGTGGAKRVALTEDQIPSHDHTINVNSTLDINDPGHSHSTNAEALGGSANYSFDGSTAEFTEVATTISTETTGVSITGDVTATADPTGGGQDHENLPPYIVAYMWKRTV
jgi:microcystin-dependent protein